jgi:hypothetical protein
VLARQRRLDALVLAGRIEVELDGGGGAVIDRGRLVLTWGEDGRPAAEPLPFGVADAAGPPALPLATDAVDEVACVSAWLEAKATKLRLVDAEHGWASVAVGARDASSRLTVRPARPPRPATAVA